MLKLYVVNRIVVIYTEKFKPRLQLVTLKDDCIKSPSHKGPFKINVVTKRVEPLFFGVISCLRFMFKFEHNI